jgi:hypothetical protein
MGGVSQSDPTGRGPRWEDDSYNAAWVTDTVNQMRGDFEKRDWLYEKTDSVLWSTYELNVPKAYQETTQETRSPLQLNIANTIAAALSVNPQQVSFEPVGRGTQAELNSERREHFFEASWKRQESEARRQLLRVFLWSLVTKGEGVLKTVERTKRAWADYPKLSRSLLKRLNDPNDPDFGDIAKSKDQKRKDQAYDAATEAYKQGRPYPIATTDVPPETFYYWLTSDGFRLCAEVTDVPYLEALDRFGATLNSRGNVVAGPTKGGPPSGTQPSDAMGLPRPEWSRVMGGTSSLTMVELWDHRNVYYCLLGPGASSTGTNSGRSVNRGTLVRTVRHGYGDPWTRTLRGPYFHAQGVTTASRLPEHAGLSVLFPFLDLFAALDSYLTIQSNAAYLTGFPAFRRVQPPGANLAASLGSVAGPGVAPFGLDGGERDALASQLSRIEPGMIYPWDVQPIEMPRSGIELDKAVGTLQRFLDMALPPIATGDLAGDPSGYAVNQAAYLSRLAWNPIVSNAEFALSERCGFESWLIENKLAEAVYAYGDSAAPSGPRGSRTGNTVRAGWLSIGPDDLNGAHRYTVKLQPDTPSNRQLEVRTHVELVKAGFESTGMAIEALGGDPGEVERELIVENMKRSEPVQKRLMDRTFQKLGIMDEQQLAQIGGVPQPGMGGPGQAPPGAGGPGLPPGLAAALAQMGGPGGPAGGPPGVPGQGGPGVPPMPGMANSFSPGNGMPLRPPMPGAGNGAPPGLPSNPAGGAVQPNQRPGQRPLPGQ